MTSRLSRSSQCSTLSVTGPTADGGVSGVDTVFRLTIVPEFQAVTLANSTLSLTWSDIKRYSWMLFQADAIAAALWQTVDGVHPRRKRLDDSV